MAQTLSDSQMDQLAATPASSAPLSDADMDKRVSQPQQPGLGSRLLTSSINALPAAGAMVGGAVGMGSPIPGGTYAGAALGGVAGTAAKQLAEGVREKGWDYFKVKDQDTSKQGLINAANAGTDQLVGGVKGVGQQMVGNVAGKVLANSALFKPASKVNSEAIEEAARRIGVQPTEGMLSSNRVTQGIESSLSQQPTYFGQKVAKGVDSVREGVNQAAEGLVSDSTSGGAYASGSEAAKGVTSKLGEQYNKIQMAYEPFNKELPKMIPDDVDKLKLFDDVANATKNTTAPDFNSNYGESIANRLFNSKNLSEIDGIRKSVQQDAQYYYNNRNFTAYDDVKKVADSLSDFRDDQFVKLAQQNGNKELGTKMVNEFQQAQGMYKSMADDLKDIGPMFGIKNKNPKDFVEAIQNIPPEQLSKKIFNVNNYDQLQTFEEHFPDAFNALKREKLGEIASKSTSQTTGDLDPARLYKNLQRLTPEVQKTLLGKKVDTLKDIQTIIQSYPKMIGPSGTPQGMSYKDILTPSGALSQISDAGKYGLLKATNSQGLQNASRNIQAFGKSPINKALMGFGARGLINGAGSEGFLNGSGQ